MSDTAESDGFDSSMNIYQRINWVRSKVDYLKKDKQIDGKYWVVTHDSLVAVVREHFVTAGVIVIPSQCDGKLLPHAKRTDRKGEKITEYIDNQRHYIGRYDIAFVNSDKPDDRFVLSMEADALDAGDKGPGKALTYAVKAALLKVLMLETGESEESRVEHMNVITADQEAELSRQISEAKANVEDFLKHYGIESLGDLPRAAFTDAITLIGAKRRAAAKRAEQQGKQPTKPQSEVK